MALGAAWMVSAGLGPLLPPPLGSPEANYTCVGGVLQPRAKRIARSQHPMFSNMFQCCPYMFRCVPLLFVCFPLCSFVVHLFSDVFLCCLYAFRWFPKFSLVFHICSHVSFAFQGRGPGLLCDTVTPMKRLVKQRRVVCSLPRKKM